jgi:superfamily II DNA helicase RecQ
MPHTSSKYILLKKHEVSINRTKSDIKDLEDKIQQVNEINKDINEAKERIKTLRNYLTQAHDESEKNEIRDEIRGLRIGLRNSIRSKDKLNLKEASAYQEEKNRLTERLKLTESSYEEINKMSNKDIQDVQKTQDFNNYHKKVLLRAYIKEVYSEEDAKEIFITLDKENDEQQIIKEEETNEDTEKNSVEEMKKENNSLISDWIDDSFFENSSKSNNFVKLETPKGFTADIKVEN